MKKVIVEISLRDTRKAYSRMEGYNFITGMVNGPHQMFTNQMNLTQTMKMKWTYWKICETLSRIFFLIVNTK